jgi:cellulose synthase (UDP-forming)
MTRFSLPNRWLDRFTTGGLPQPGLLSSWLIDYLPQFFDGILQWLNRSQYFILMGCLLWLTLPLITKRPTIWEQGAFAIALSLLGALILRLDQRERDRQRSEQLHLLLIMLSGITTLRYWYYRTNSTLNFDGWLNSFACLLLYSAEMYAILTLFLAYFQTLKIRERKAIDLSLIPQEEWFSVDVYIPTYNEDVEIVRKTVLAALAIDYPADKKQVYILDDGRKFPERREQLHQMCEELGATLLTRENNDHAKAGNINTALEKTGSELILILDCDHIPVRHFLKQTAGFFYNARVALVQTPHWFYNPDPFERNLLTSGRVPVGNELFYKVLQKGNDTWNSAFFCGSAAVIRRDYLLEVGGIATETVTEDCHTSLKLHSHGYETVYYDKIMVAGLAPEKFSAYVGQQVRWARGMAQILRLENPLFNRKLNLGWSQRICYFSATTHFFFGFPRLVYVVSPVLYLLLGISSVRGLGLETLFYALPHIVLSMQTNHIPYKHVRFSFWNEVYEFAMSFQAGIVTMLALINPRLGQFNVTDKGLQVTERNFDMESVRYLVILAVITLGSLLAVPFWLLISPQDTQAVLVNAMWCVFNLFLLVAACLVAFEQPQRRKAHRLPRQLNAIIHSGNQQWSGTTVNVSETGARIILDEWPNIPDEVRVELVGDFGARVLLDAQIVRSTATSRLQAMLAVHFVNMTETQWDDLVLVLYSDVEEWYAQKRTESDNPVSSFQFLATSLLRVFREFIPESGAAMRKQVRAIAQLYWEGWEGHFYTATLTEISTRNVRLEIDNCEVANLDLLQTTQPTVGILMNLESNLATSISLVAEVQMVHVFVQPSNRIVLELTFPTWADQQQKNKIKQLLQVLAG